MPGDNVAMKVARMVAGSAKVVNSERMMQTLRGKTAKDEVAERRAAQIKKLAAVTKEVRNFPVSAAEIYGNTKLGYITNQVLKFQGDWANFLPPSAQT